MIVSLTREEGLSADTEARLAAFTELVADENVLRITQRSAHRQAARHVARAAQPGIAASRNQPAGSRFANSRASELRLAAMPELPTSGSIGANPNRSERTEQWNRCLRSRWTSSQLPARTRPEIAQ
jgi:hypothetical protein